MKKIVSSLIILTGMSLFANDTLIFDNSKMDEKVKNDMIIESAIEECLKEIGVKEIEEADEEKLVKCMTSKGFTKPSDNNEKDK